MTIIEHLDDILKTIACHFKQRRVFSLFKSHVAGNLGMSGRHCISNVICFKGGSDEDWSRDYRVFSKSQWDSVKCMNGVFLQALSDLPASPFIPIAVDLTSLRKHGKKIPFCSYQVDPLSPPFQKGLMWAQRFLHASLLIPMHQHSLPARGVPVRLELSSAVKKPGKRAIKEDHQAYRAAKKLWNSNIHTTRMFQQFRQLLDDQAITTTILQVADGGFCNRQIFTSLPDRVDVISRCRKDSKLCYRSANERKFYSEAKFTPEETRKNEEIPFRETAVFYGGSWREIRFKELTNVYWQKGAQKRPLRMFAIEPVPYRRTASGNNNYRDPCYLLTTDLVNRSDDLLQAYFNRIEIEQNHRDMKNNLGLGQGQVHSKQATERHPQMLMIAYSASLLATHRALGPHRSNEFIKPPKWYLGRKRPSIEDIKRQIRDEFKQHPCMRNRFGLWVSNEIGSIKLSL